MGFTNSRLLLLIVQWPTEASQQEDYVRIGNPFDLQDRNAALKLHSQRESKQDLHGLLSLRME